MKNFALKNEEPLFEVDVAFVAQNIRDSLILMHGQFSFAAENAVNHRDKAYFEDRVRKVSKSLRVFNAVIENCPPFLSIAIIDVRQKEPKKKGDMSIPYFLEIVAKHSAINLAKMGLSEEEIQRIKKDRKLPTNKDAVVDSIVPLDLGGERRRNNLVMIPEHLSFLRSQFVLAQHTIRSLSQGQILLDKALILIPSNKIDCVPFVPYTSKGFRETPVIRADNDVTHLKQRNRLIRERIDEYFPVKMLK